MATIQDKRLERGWSQTELAVHSGLSYGTISRVEQGKPVTRANLKKICDALEVKPGDVEGYTLHNPLQIAAQREAARRESKRRALA